MNEREAIFARTFFDHNQWSYEPRVFHLSPNCSYTPDFYDAKRDVYIEVVGSRQAYSQNKVKYDFFRAIYPELKFELRRPDREIFINRKHRKQINRYCGIKTQTEIANAAGITQQFISRILTGRARPSWQTAKRLAEITKTEPVMWLEGSPEEIKAAIGKGGNGDE